jgi:hypothetical protein
MTAQTSPRDRVLRWLGPFSGNTVPAIENFYKTRNSSVYMVLCIVYMQDGLHNTVSISQNCRPIQTKWNTTPINVTEKLKILLLETIPVIYYKHINFMKLSNRLNNIKLSQLSPWTFNHFTANPFWILSNNSTNFLPRLLRNATELFVIWFYDGCKTFPFTDLHSMIHYVQ